MRNVSIHSGCSWVVIQIAVLHFSATEAAAASRVHCTYMKLMHTQAYTSTFLFLLTNLKNKCVLFSAFTLTYTQWMVSILQMFCICQLCNALHIQTAAAAAAFVIIIANIVIILFTLSFYISDFAVCVHATLPIKWTTQSFQHILAPTPTQHNPCDRKRVKLLHRQFFSNFFVTKLLISFRFFLSGSHWAIHTQLLCHRIMWSNEAILLVLNVCVRKRKRMFVYLWFCRFKQ